jgi:putative ABC transport system substrate-binding protein
VSHITLFAPKSYGNLDIGVWAFADQRGGDLLMIRRREFIAGLGAAWWPLAARAQQPTMPVVGFLAISPLRLDTGFVAEVRRGLADAGFVEGRNVAIEYRWASNRGRPLPLLAAELVERKVAVIVANGGPPVFAAKAATSTIPIVFALTGDPIELGLIASLNRPGGNLTGIAGMATELTGKRLDLLHEMAPLTMTIALITDPTARDSEWVTKEMLATAQALRLQAIVLEARSAQDIDAAFATLVERGAGALVVGPQILFQRNREKIVDLAARHKIPAIYPGRGFVRVGGLLSYDTKYTANNRQIGSFYIPQILKGAKPDDLPVQRPTEFELVINLNTAKTLGLTISPNLLLLADEVIE